MGGHVISVPMRSSESMPPRRVGAVGSGSGGQRSSSVVGAPAVAVKRAMSRKG